MAKINPDELEVAKLAALVGGQLKEVDNSTIQKNTAGPANKLDPRSFISKPIKQQPPKHQAKIPGVVQEQKITPAGAEVQGTVNVNMNELMIPMDGLDEETRKAMQAHMGAPINTPPIAPPPAPMPQQVEGPKVDIKPANKIVNDETTKGINYLKRKLRAIEKNQDKIIKMLEGINEKR